MNGLSQIIEVRQSVVDSATGPGQIDDRFPGEKDAFDEEDGVDGNELGPDYLDQRGSYRILQCLMWLEATRRRQ